MVAMHGAGSTGPPSWAWTPGHVPLLSERLSKSAIPQVDVW